MSIKTVANCDICETDIEIGTRAGMGTDIYARTKETVVCWSCWERDCKAGVEELAEVKAENAALRDENTAVCAALEETRKRLKRVEAEKLSVETALGAKTDLFIPLMNGRLAEAGSKIAELESELAERDSFEDCDCPEEGRGWPPNYGPWGCNYDYDTRVEYHPVDVYHKVSDKRKLNQ